MNFIWREAPKKDGSDINSWVRFSGVAIFFFFNSRTRYDIRHTLVYTKWSSTVWRMAGWSVLETAETPLSECAIARCQSRYHAPFLTDALPFVSWVKTDTLA